MGPWPCILLLGLLLLPGWGTAQAFGSTENSTEEDHWPRLVISRNLPFSCDPKMLRSNISSSSVHTLRPSDIRFVASIGIKETFPALITADVMEQLQRAEKMSQEVCLGVGTVLSGIIRSFSSTVLSHVCTPKRKVVPQSGPEHLWAQTTDLVKIMRENPKLDFENDWKLINVFISNVNECYLCPLTGQHSILTRTMDKLAATLDFLYEEVPRTFVNLVDLTEILEFSAFSEARTPGRDNTESCRCSEETVLSRAVARWSYQDTWEKMLISSRYNRKESFALVLQPFFYEAEQFFFLKEQPLQDPTALGLHLWNIMMEPTGHKDTPYSMRERRPVKCPPKEHPYLFTYRNSNYQSWLSKPHYDAKGQDVLFICTYNPPSPTNPLSVHRLKPADIKVVAAVGDAFTAANGAGSRPLDFTDVMTEYRGLSWSIGGDRSLRTIITLPNILRQFNSHLKGYSVGTGKETTDGAWLNQAVSKAFSGDLSNQIRELIRMMKTDKRINYNEDWKLLTMFIGNSDLCDFCNDQVTHSPVAFRRNIQRALDILHAEVPRMFVNMVLPMELIGLRELSQDKRLSCNVPFLRRICPCLMLFSDGDPQLARLAEVNKEYQVQVEQLVESGRYDKRDDFTVVLQPFFERLEVPRTKEGLLDLTYFAPDCFHFSQKTHGHIASALWNNMAGNGLGSEPDNILAFTVDYRGLSFSGGGDGSLDNVTTLPNILRKFNSKLTGYGTCTGDAQSISASFNQAVPRAKAKDLLKQATALVERMENNTEINFNEDWKLITVMIGNNDLCDSCKNKVPRAMVNLVDFMDPEFLRLSFQRTLKCVKPRASYACDCVLSPKTSSSDVIFLDNMIETYQNALHTVLGKSRYDTKEDFTVVLQPFMANIRIPSLRDGSLDASFFISDCFHPSQKFHSQLARALWNNMTQGVGDEGASPPADVYRNETMGP
ncbi:phospholipase B1, membrane-associated-like [Sorex araneus]|uniref:phospholipase B1, membrane-associated-like n=1 Tax=Sorex araneus TaxID=42254 RepID=UPI0024337D91|nr:phospholipase B1, membrane-associated-like [Sorex araneus]